VLGTAQDGSRLAPGGEPESDGRDKTGLFEKEFGRESGASTISAIWFDADSVELLMTNLSSMTRQQQADIRRQVLSDVATKKLRAKCRNIYRHQCEKAKKLNLALPDYTVGQLTTIVAASIGTLCEFCKKKITIANVQIDHGRPLTRGGTFELSNIFAGDSACNMKKGSLTREEYGKLLVFIADNFPDAARADVMTRLGIGGKWKR
jgi:hypothetical protein